MTQQTTGLVLHTTLYGETSVIARIFTRQLGVRSYIVKGVRTPKGRTKQNLLQPLSYLDMVVYTKPRDINFIKEMRPAQQWRTLDTQPEKTAIRFFASEALYKSLRADDPTPELFDYVVHSMEQLDNEQQAVVSYPLTFLIGLSRQLGIEPLDNYSTSTPYFNLSEGCFQSAPAAASQLSAYQSQLLHAYLDNSEGQDVRAPREQRLELLASLISYYQIHLSDFKNFKSHEVLHNVLD